VGKKKEGHHARLAAVVRNSYAVRPGARGGDPTEHQIRAAAQAPAGRFAEALDSERRAIEMARKLRWDVSPLQGRLARYQAGQAWSGNLLTL
jgi:hypothetical protein